jgi:hypothetical protein
LGIHTIQPSGFGGLHATNKTYPASLTRKKRFSAEIPRNDKALEKREGKIICVANFPQTKVDIFPLSLYLLIEDILTIARLVFKNRSLTGAIHSKCQYTNAVLTPTRGYKYHGDISNNIISKDIPWFLVFSYRSSGVRY